MSHSESFDEGELNEVRNKTIAATLVLSNFTPCRRCVGYMRQCECQPTFHMFEIRRLAEF